MMYFNMTSVRCIVDNIPATFNVYACAKCGLKFTAENEMSDHSNKCENVVFRMDNYFLYKGMYHHKDQFIRLSIEEKFQTPQMLATHLMTLKCPIRLVPIEPKKASAVMPIALQKPGASKTTIYRSKLWRALVDVASNEFCKL